MKSKDRIIFQEGERTEITEEEHKKSLEPYEQQKELYSCLEAWSSHAVEVLRSKGYSEGYDEIGSLTDDEQQALIAKPTIAKYGSVYELMWLPQALLPGADTETKSADEVLRAIKKLHTAIFQKDKNRIANAGIEVGIAVAKAHAEPYEMLTSYGQEKKKSEIKGGKASKKSKGIYEKLRQIKEDNPNFSAEKAWIKLFQFASGNNSVVKMNREVYELGIEAKDGSYDYNPTTPGIKIVSFHEKTGIPDGRGITRATLKNKYKKI